MGHSGESWARVLVQGLPTMLSARTPPANNAESRTSSKRISSAVLVIEKPE